MMAASSRPMPAWVKYCCPACKGDLVEQPEVHACMRCQRNFPVVFGIPDFRLRPDPYLGIAEDHAKARLLAEKFEEFDLRGLVEYYWRLTPDTPAELARRFVDHALDGQERGRHWLSAVGMPRRVLRGQSEDCLSGEVGEEGGGGRGAASFEALSQEHPARHPDGTPRTGPDAAPVLELGCRSGGVLAAVAETGAAAVGIDIALRWLVVARKCLDEAGLVAQLCCCDAEHLPFPEGSFGLVLAENVLEHTAQPMPLLAEAHRVLQVDGLAWGTTWNRLAPAPEPHVRLWGVGWLPRAMARWYVRWRGKGDYDHVHLRSAFELRRLLHRSPFVGGGIHAAALPPAMVERLPIWLRGLAEWYQAVRRGPLVGEVLAWVGPVLEWRGVRRAPVA